MTVAMICEILAEFRRQEESRGGFGEADQRECIAATADALGMDYETVRGRLADAWAGVGS